MPDLEEQLRGVMQVDAKVYRARNQIAERTDPQSRQESRDRKLAKLKPVEAEPPAE
jgi:hypothetical protein